MSGDRLSGIRLWLTTGFRAAPLLSAAGVGVGALAAIQAPAQAAAAKILVNGIIQHDRRAAVWAAAVSCCVLLVRFMTGLLAAAVQSTAADRVHDFVRADLMRITTRIPGIRHHEQPEVADRIALLQQGSRGLADAVTTLFAVVAALINAGAIVILLAGIHPLLMLLPVIGLVRVWTSYTDAKLRFGAFDRVIGYRRLADRLTRIARSPAHAVEVRVFGIQQLLLDRIGDNFARVADGRLAATRKGMYYELAARVVFGSAFLAAIAFVAVGVRGGALSAGDLALLVILGSRVDETAGGVAAALRRSGETVGLFNHYSWFRRQAEESTGAAVATSNPPARLRHGIELRHVTFGYPNSIGPALTDINLTIGAGASVALVGENGAGKSTLIKLLTKLYEPSQGKILLDGEELGAISPALWRLRTSAAFQDFARFEFTAATTVGLGDLPRIENTRTIRAALDAADAAAVVDALPAGMRTQLGTSFIDGTDLSGGQWQRLALARSFMRTVDNPTAEPLLLLLDEPTAALDPDAEHALYEHIAAAARAGRRTGTITVLVSHRLSMVRMADQIIVLHRGRIAETGTHPELIAANGRYAELFNLQARAYRQQP
ncbi:ATP-binding cassette domain-containing protein [Microlunatus soli]|uniref:ATP-binding cassette, subfamily B n=1 Tax=Microlunatus soli TaxID=630515 RepID=A0A1H1S5W1_9ACTN|nr:ABC transporter ATP-binding protein [Microlunatus soli]SDS43387.1 ATP-binding cassette, subfamily B [Microlunatus soli]